MNNKGKKKHNKGSAAVSRHISDKLFKVVLIVLAVILVIMIAAFLYGIAQDHGYYTSSPNDILRGMKNGFYSDAVVEMKENIALGETVQKNPDYIIPYAAARYFDSEYRYVGYTKAAELTDDQAMKAEFMKKAEEYKADMDEALNEMGELSFLSEEIDKTFEW